MIEPSLERRERPWIVAAVHGNDDWLVLARLRAQQLEARLRQGLQSPNLCVQTVLRQRGH